MDKKEYANRKGIWIILLLICLFLAGSVVNLSNELDEVNTRNSDLSEKISVLEDKVKKVSKESKVNREDVDNEYFSSNDPLSRRN